MSELRTIAVAVLIALGGCQGLVPGLDGDEATETPAPDGTVEAPTATPGGDETPTRTETDDGPDYLAPGLTDEGVLNVTLLLDSHYAALERESGNGTYVAVVRSTRSELGFPPEERFTARQRYVVDHPDRWYHERIRTNETADEATVHEEWADGTGWVVRADRRGEPVEYDRRTLSGTPGHPELLDTDLRSLLRSIDPRRTVDVTVEEQARDEATVYVVSSTVREESTTVTSTFHIRDDGYIFHYSQESVQDPPSGETIVTDRHLAFDARPDGSLEEPDWVEDARESLREGDADDAS